MAIVDVDNVATYPDGLAAQVQRSAAAHRCYWLGQCMCVCV